MNELATCVWLEFRGTINYMPPNCPFFNGSIYWCSLPVPPVCGAFRGRWFVSVGYRSLDWEAPYVRILTCTQTWYSWWDPQPCTAWCCSAVKLLKMGPLGRRWVYFARGRNINNLCLKDRLCVFFIHVMYLQIPLCSSHWEVVSMPSPWN